MELAAKVSWLLSEPSRRAQMGSRARELVQRFGRQQICERFESLVEIVLSSTDSTALDETLHEQFRDSVPDLGQFIRRMSAEYERGASMLVEANRAELLTALGGQRRRGWVRELAVVRFANDHLYKPYVKPALRRAGKPFRRAA